jgi:CheY-like chemotaxis protein/HPt (histidine-containing phosphotransfer) domain-containing protein
MGRATAMAICILYLDGDSGFSASIKAIFESKGVEIALTLARSEREFQSALDTGACDLILAEDSLPDYDGVSALKEALRRKSLIPFIFISSAPGDKAATEALRLGAADYLARSDPRRIFPVVERVLRIDREMRELRKQGDAARFESEAASQEAMAASAELFPHAGFASLRILVAEDNTVNQVVVSKLLEALGCASPQVVGNGRQALAAFRGKEFDIVFMDCHMPDLDGYAATARIRRLEARGGGKRRCYIAAMTADIMPGVEEQCRAAGMDGQLTKPYAIEDLIATLERARGQAVAAESRAARLPERSGGDEAAGGKAAPSQGGDWGGMDLRILDRLRLLGGKESPSIFRDLVRDFLETIPEKGIAIRQLARTRGFRPLAFAAHGLKGLCLNFGALAMARECEALQLAAEGERLDDLPRLLERLSAAEVRTRTFLEGMIGAVAADASSDPIMPSSASAGGDSDG